jgi:rhamnogalacturonyl hydrolase YesR
MLRAASAYGIFRVEHGLTGQRQKKTGQKGYRAVQNRLQMNHRLAFR